MRDDALFIMVYSDGAGSPGVFPTGGKPEVRWTHSSANVRSASTGGNLGFSAFQVVLDIAKYVILSQKYVVLCAPFHPGWCAGDYSREPPNGMTLPRNPGSFPLEKGCRKHGFVS